MKTLLLTTLLFASITAPAATPYAGQQERPIKALSAEDVEGYLAGKGMGLAKAAELNGYPGPMHVLELASQLQLTEGQRTRTEALFASMKAKATSLGRELVESERRLDALFAARAAQPPQVDAALQEIGALQARVRGAHLEAHLAQAAILTPAQVARYSELRGYAANAAPGAHRHHH